MKNKLPHNPCVSNIEIRNKISRPLLAVVLLSFLNFNIAVAGDSAVVKIKLQKKNVSMGEVLTEIEKQSGYKFTYNNERINTDKKVSIDVYNADLDQALHKLLENTGVSYSIQGKQIILFTPSRPKQDGSSQENVAMPETTAQASQQVLLEPLKIRGDIQITGKVTDKNDGSPIPGVSVVLKGTTNGTITDADGNFTLNAPGDGVLIFSFIGYKNTEIPIGNATSLSVSMEPDVKEISEVVVVGYGTVKKQDLTGVVAVVDAKSFNKGTNISPEQLMVGKVAGVQVTPGNGGEPGGQWNIKIRGGTSINASSQPLYVIDGVPIDNNAFSPTGFTGNGRNPLNFINPNDIESFTVLKDASAAAIYGSRGANGVIIITTKKGVAGKPTVSYDAFVSIGTIYNRLDLMTGDQYRAATAAYDAANATSYSARLGTANTNWMDQILQTAIGQNHVMSLSSGTDKSSYRFSVGYQDQNGIIKKTNTKRINFSLNYNTKLLNDKLNIAANVKGAVTTDTYAPGIGNAVNMDPTQPVYDPGNAWGGYWEWSQPLGTKNPLAENELTQDAGKTYRSLGNLKLDYNFDDLVKGLSANVNLGYDINNSARKQFLPSYLRSQYLNKGSITQQNLYSSSLLLETYLAYKRDFAAINSKIDVTAGYSYQSFDREQDGFWAYNLSSNLLEGNSTTAANNHLSNAYLVQNRLISFYGRVNYSFKDKYLFTFTMRDDGSTRFGPTFRHGVFPSAALAWRMSDENFMKGIQPVVSDLKLRVGYGVTGNQEIDNYLYLTTYQYGDIYSQYQLGDSLHITARPSAVDPNLKWEQTSTLNVGLDFGLFNNRITGSLEYYNKNTSDLLFVVNKSAGTALSNQVLTNVGKVKNEGVELSLNGYAVNTEKFKWNIGFNASYNKNKLVYLNGNDDPTYVGYPTGDIAGGVGNRVQLLKVGEAVNSFYVYEQKYNSSGNPIYTATPNDLSQQTDQYVDQNNDGIINEKDRIVYKKPSPDLILGLTSQINYGNFDMSFTLRSNIGGYTYNNVASQLTNYQRMTNGNAPENLLNSVNNTKFGAPQYFSSYYVENASFVRLDNVTIGYTINFGSKSVGNRSSEGISSTGSKTGGFNGRLRVYATAQNVFVITGYSGLDPEVSTSTNIYNGSPVFGIDNNLYPRTRTFTFGLSLGF